VYLKAQKKANKEKKTTKISFSQKVEDLLSEYSKGIIVLFIIVISFSSCGVAKPAHGCKATYGMSGY
jgi:hypothetical protein